MPPESDPRVLSSYKCHTCKIIKEPEEFGNNNKTGFKLVTCRSCFSKREDVERRAFQREYEADMLACKTFEELGIPYKHVKIYGCNIPKQIKKAKAAREAMMVELNVNNIICQDNCFSSNW